MFQKTLNHAIHCSGIALHSGKKVNLALHPAPVNHGIVFRCTKNERCVHIPAQASYVTDTRLCTSLERDGIRLSTVEHLLSALAGLGIDNAYIDVDGPEIPIMDGSAAPFVFLIQSAGIQQQTHIKKVIKIKQRIEITDGDCVCSLSPSQSFKISYHLDYEHPLLSNKKRCIDFSTQAYTREVSRARTFGFVHEIESLQKAGLALGGSLDNAIVLDPYRVINDGGLRYDDECLRHKILDTVGDLYLAGHQIIAHFEGYKTGHKMNHQLVMAMLEQQHAWSIEELDSRAIIEEHNPLNEHVLQA